MASEMLAAWLMTLALHASVLLAIAWLIDRGALRMRPAWREAIWRAALFGAVVTASAQMLFGAPASMRIAVRAATRDVVPASAAPTESHAFAAPLASTSIGDHSVAKNTTVISAPAAAATNDGARADAGASTRDAPRSRVRAWLMSRNIDWPAWPIWLIAAWLAGGCLTLSRLAVSWIRLERSIAQSRPIDNARLATDVEALAIQARIAAPRLASLGDIASPIAARARRILLPCWAIDLLDRDQLRAMLAHETAHIARRDPEWKIAIAAWCALFWFVPMAALARRRLDEIAEVSCDAWAAIHLGDGRSLAECLAECAERRVGTIDFELAPAMASRESPLLRRIDYLIAGVPINTQAAGARAGVATAFALAVAAFALPGVTLRQAAAQSAPAPPAPPSVAPARPSVPAAPAKPATSVSSLSLGSGSHIHISSDSSDGDHDSTIVQVSDAQHSYRVDIEGKVTFNDREDDVATLSPGGTAKFSDTHDGVARRVEIAERGGTLERRYFVANKEQPLDAGARRWMAELIPSVIRETAIDAEGRVARLRAQGGVDAVLDEIARIDSAYARGVYIGVLAKGGKLSNAQMTRALELVDAIGGDYEKRNALVALGKMQPLDAAQQKLVLAQADKIGGDYERAELLVALLPQLAPDKDVHAAWLHAADGIHGDYEHRRVLTALLTSGKEVDEATLTNVVAASKTIGSDYDRRELLASAIRRTHDADSLAATYGAAAADIGSAYDKREALMALIHAQGFGKAGARAVLDASAHLDSDYDCREVLVALAAVMPDDPELISRYRAVARHLSDFERGQAEKALDRFSS